ncbi:efflux RND transporter periplasmic adaptor subunit [Pseudoteredinibacter isoporae]|uniref:RND family efflux transporter MFP subunit n=1 Tax=Pseudoteredinibacter isoporae TaxID=570281 RepID=A0A7X0JR40_9GAMM|nr:efflux RND transporter periplasmic adaptor subunit [Pseudoteredinibacter isoporae]MBB6519831.1 RND family efflux transporter MFP subunit [Pseudoteredinibacter isoporae]NHO85410.1 efflux RND transporter periplasmic adaptor subunit [Pseudoteredinibacter isoporae]NIB26138.1 efflux RND transporter periplasmic adaptor subunit [Pseudoteredinibacter isoporae]
MGFIRFLQQNTLPIKRSGIALAAAALIAGCSEQLETQQAVPPKAIKYFSVGEESSGSVRKVTGIVEPSDKTDLSFRVDGKVSNVLVKQGDLVSKDQVLAELDPKDYRTSLSSAQAQLNQARAEQQNSSSELKRNQQLFAKKLVAQATIDKLQAAADAANSQVKVAEDRVQEANRNLERTKLRAPFAGTINTRTLEPFQSVQSGNTVFQLQGDTGFKIKVPAAESMMPYIEYGQLVSSDFPAVPGLSLEGQVSSIGSQVEAGSSFPVKVQLSGDTSNIRAGMTANVTFSFRAENQETPIYMIPVSALSESNVNKDDNRFAGVLLFNPETSLLEKREIELGDLRDNSVEVIKGLNKGDKIASAGLPFLFAGQEVTLWEPEWRQEQ